MIRKNVISTEAVQPYRTAEWKDPRIALAVALVIIQNESCILQGPWFRKPPKHLHLLRGSNEDRITVDLPDSL
jgi:hypothetical protein